MSLQCAYSHDSYLFVATSFELTCDLAYWSGKEWKPNWRGSLVDDADEILNVAVDGEDLLVRLVVLESVVKEYVSCEQREGNIFRRCDACETILSIHLIYIYLYCSTTAVAIITYILSNKSGQKKCKGTVHTYNYSNWCEGAQFTFLNFKLTEINTDLVKQQ